ncbi:MAG: hypothetical protein ACYDCF_08860 [Burkholderiales bacterium]
MLKSFIAKPVIRRQGIAALFVFCASVTAFAQDPVEASPKRFPQITMENVPPQSRALAQEIAAISSVGLAGPYNVMLRSPIFAERAR